MTSVAVLYGKARVLLNVANSVASTHTVHARKLNKGSSHLLKTHSDGIKFRKVSWIKAHLYSYHVRGELGKSENKFSLPVCAAMCAKYVLPTKAPACWKIIGRNQRQTRKSTKITIFVLYTALRVCKSL